MFRVAAIQMCSGIDIEKNIERLRNSVADAAGQGALYIQTPEMTGALMRDRDAFFASLRNEAEDPLLQAASALASQYGVYLHIGSTAVRYDAERAANRGVIFDPNGKKLASYDKIHMFDVDLDNGESWRESNTYHPGDQSSLVELPFATLGMAICYDIRFPQIFQTQALAGATLLTAPAAFTRQTGQAHWHILQRARAIENGAFMISAAQGGVHEDGRNTYGHSIIISPWGEILAEADHDQPCVIIADIDPSQCQMVRNKIPNLKNRREFSVSVHKGE